MWELTQISIDLVCSSEFLIQVCRKLPIFYVTPTAAVKQSAKVLGPLVVFVLFFRILVLVFLFVFCILCFFFCIFVSENSAFVCVWSSKTDIHAYPELPICVVTYGLSYKTDHYSSINTLWCGFPHRMALEHGNRHPTRLARRNHSPRRWYRVNLAAPTGCSGQCHCCDAATGAHIGTSAAVPVEKTQENQIPTCRFVCPMKDSYEQLYFRWDS